MGVASDRFKAWAPEAIELAADPFAENANNMEQREIEFVNPDSEESPKTGQKGCIGFLLLLFSGAAIYGGVQLGGDRPPTTALCTSAASLNGTGFELKGNFNPETGVLSVEEAERSLNVIIGDTVSTTNPATGAQSVLGNHVMFDTPSMSETFAGELLC